MEAAKPIETLLENAENYAKTTLELVKLSAIDKTSEAISTISAKIAVFVMIALFTIIANIGLSLWIGDMLGKPYYGFFAVAGFYAIVAAFVYGFRESWVKHPVQNAVIEHMLKEKSYGK
ncbi:MAG: hypothetical protein ABI388_03295 [Bacteroidia bacterium]